MAVSQHALGRGVSARGQGEGCLHGACACQVGGGGEMSAAHNPSVNRITDACENITLPQLRCGR